MYKNLQIYVYGVVQGVGFRYAAQKEAIRLGLVGYAENMKDGSLYIEVEGDDESIRYFLGWCYKGPPQANVERVVYYDGKMMGYKDFRIY